MTIHLAASGGGHLDVLRIVAGALGDEPRTWLTTPGRGADALRAQGDRVLELPVFDRRNKGVGNLVASVRLAARERPELVITSGAGVALAFTAAARASGSRVLFVETMARVTDSSLSGRVFARLAAQTLVQWPEMAAVHPGAVVCRPALLETLVPGEARPGVGTFVALGTHHQPFDRLLAVVARAVRAGVLGGPVHGQRGATSDAALAGIDADVKAWDTPDGMLAGLGAADVVVCHAGSGIIASSLRAGRRPLIVPRLARHGEHVDDHQEQLARKLTELGLAVLVDDEITPAHLERVRAPLAMPAWPPGLPRLEDALRGLVG